MKTLSLGRSFGPRSPFASVFAVKMTLEGFFFVHHVREFILSGHRLLGGGFLAVCMVWCLHWRSTWTQLWIP